MILQPLLRTRQSDDEHRDFIKVFLEFNQNAVDFKRLTLTPQKEEVHDAWSMVPELQTEIDYLETLLPLLDTVDLLDHKKHVELCIQSTQNLIESEKKITFMRD